MPKLVHGLAAAGLLSKALASLRGEGLRALGELEVLIYTHIDPKAYFSGNASVTLSRVHLSVFSARLAATAAFSGFRTCYQPPHLPSPDYETKVPYLSRWAVIAWPGAGYTFPVHLSRIRCAW